MRKIGFELYVNDQLVSGSYEAGHFYAEAAIAAINERLNEVIPNNTVALQLDSEPRPVFSWDDDLQDYNESVKLLFLSKAEVTITRGNLNVPLGRVTQDELRTFLAGEARLAGLSLDINRKPLPLQPIMQDGEFRPLLISQATYGTPTIITLWDFDRFDTLSIEGLTPIEILFDSEGQENGCIIKLYRTARLPSVGVFENESSTESMRITDANKQAVVYMPSHRDGRVIPTMRNGGSSYGQIDEYFSLNDQLDFSVLADFNSMQSLLGMQGTKERSLNWLTATSNQVTVIPVGLAGNEVTINAAMDLTRVATHPMKAARMYKLTSTKDVLVELELAADLEYQYRWLPMQRVIDVANPNSEYIDYPFAVLKDDGRWVTQFDASNTPTWMTSGRSVIQAIVRPDQPLLIGVEAHAYWTFDDAPQASLKTFDWGDFVDAAPVLTPNTYTAFNQSFNISQQRHSSNQQRGVLLRKIIVTEPTRLLCAINTADGDRYKSNFFFFKEKVNLGGNGYYFFNEPGQFNWYVDSSGNTQSNTVTRLAIIDLLEPGTYYVRIETEAYYFPSYDGFFTTWSIASYKRAFSTTYNESSGVLTYQPKGAGDELITSFVDGHIPWGNNTNYFSPRYFNWGYRRLFDDRMDGIIHLRRPNNSAVMMINFTKTDEPPLMWANRTMQYPGLPTGSDSYAVLMVSGSNYDCLKIYREGSVIKTYGYNTNNFANGQPMTELDLAIAYNHTAAPYVWLYVDVSAEIVYGDQPFVS